MFKLKPKPKKPKRLVFEEYLGLIEGACSYSIVNGYLYRYKFSEIIKIALEKGFSQDQIEIQMLNNSGFNEISFHALVPEDDDHFNDRMKRYKKKLAEYRNWEKENADKIKKEKDRMEKEKRDKLLAEIESLENCLRKKEEKFLNFRK